MSLRLAPLVLLPLVIGLAACTKDIPGNEREVGDCVEDQDALDDGNSTVSCDEDHVFELYAAIDLDPDDDDYPGDADIESQAKELCRGTAFEDFVGVPYVESSEVYTFPRWPSQETWEQADDRTVLCYATTEDLSPTTGSFGGLNR